MTTAGPTLPQASHASYWQAPSTSSPDYQMFPRLRVRLVTLVAALVVQATIALLGVLPELPGVPDASDSYVANQPVNFWVQYA